MIKDVTVSRMDKFVQPITIFQWQGSVKSVNPQCVVMCLVRRLGTNVTGDDLWVAVYQSAGVTVPALDKLVEIGRAHV